jgi:hypothetical protein
MISVSRRFNVDCHSVELERVDVSGMVNHFVDDNSLIRPSSVYQGAWDMENTLSIRSLIVEVSCKVRKLVARDDGLISHFVIQSHD